MRVVYSRHYRKDAQGHIFMDKEGACTIHLIGAASMTQAELDYYGEVIARALLHVTPYANEE